MPIYVGNSSVNTSISGDRLKLANTASDPASGAAGQMYYNTGDMSIRVSNGSSWGTITPVSSIITTGMALYWNATDASSYSGSGTTIYDLSGNGNHGTLTNGTTWDPSFGGRFVFDGINDQINSSYRAPGGARSLFMWLYYDSVNTNDGTGYQLQGVQESGAYMYLGMINGGTGYFYIGTGAGGSASYSVPTGQWLYYGITFDGTNYTVYMNNVVKQTGTASSGSASTNTFYGGAINSSYHFYGKCAEWQVYSRGLSATEVAVNWNAGRGRYGL